MAADNLHNIGFFVKIISLYIDAFKRERTMMI